MRREPGLLDGVLKAKGGIVSGLLSKKKTGDVSKKEPVVTPFAHSPTKHPASPTSSLEVIASTGEKARKKKKVSGKSFLPTFWDDVDMAALKAHEAFSMDDLSPLMAKSSSEVMSSHIQKLVQVATFEAMIKSLSAKNETFKNKAAILTVEAKNDKERVAVLEKSLQVEATTVKEFKDSDEYSNDPCGYYVEGFDFLRKWMAKHHPNLDLSGLVMGEVKKELLADRPFEATVENVTEEATDNYNPCRPYP
nr:hypothetical protein CFP56_31175 [Quercus suber]